MCHRSSSYFLGFRQFLNELCPFLDLKYLFSALFFYMLWCIALKLCIRLCIDVSQIKFIFPEISSIFEWVMPLFGLRIFVKKFLTGVLCTAVLLFPYTLIMIFNPFPHTTILLQTTLNIFCQKIENLYNWMDNLWPKVENIVAKGEIARSEQFLLLSLCFQKAVCCRGIRKHLYEGKG